MVESLTPAQRQLRVATLSLARDSVWWMTEYKLHETWELGVGSCKVCRSQRQPT